MIYSKYSRSWCEQPLNLIIFQGVGKSTEILCYCLPRHNEFYISTQLNAYSTMSFN